MEPTPHDKFLEEFDRESLADWKARKESERTFVPAARVLAMLVELERRCTEAGTADPAIARELCEKLKRGEPF